MNDGRSSSVSDRMRRQLDRSEASPPSTMEVVAPAHLPSSKPFPRRITLDLTDDDHRALKQAALDSRVPMADLLRVLVRLWRSDPDFAGAAARWFPQQ